MPKVGKKHFPYTEQGKRDAKVAKKKGRKLRYDAATQTHVRK